MKNPPPLELRENTTRLSLKIGGKLGGERPTGNSSIGWTLLEIAPPPPGVTPLARGECPIPQSATGSRPLSSAEYHSMREDCGLSQSEAAALHRVSVRSVQHWEQPEGRGVPDGAAREMLDLRAKLDAAVEAGVNLARAQRDAGNISADALITLYRYAARNYPQSRAGREGLPHGAHNRLLSLQNRALAREGFEVEIVYALP